MNEGSHLVGSELGEDRLRRRVAEHADGLRTGGAGGRSARLSRHDEQSLAKVPGPGCADCAPRLLVFDERPFQEV